MRTKNDNTDQLQKSGMYYRSVHPSDFATSSLLLESLSNNCINLISNILCETYPSENSRVALGTSKLRCRAGHFRVETIPKVEKASITELK